MAAIRLKYPADLFRTTHSWHHKRTLFVIIRSALLCGGRQHRNDRKNDLTCLKSGCPVLGKSGQADVAIRIAMLVDWGLSDKHYLGCFKGISFVKPKLQSKRFTRVKCSLSSLEPNVPDIVLLVYNFEFKYIGEISHQILSFFVQSFCTIHLIN